MDYSAACETVEQVQRLHADCLAGHRRLIQVAPAIADEARQIIKAKPCCPSGHKIIVRVKAPVRPGQFAAVQKRPARDTCNVVPPQPGVIITMPDHTLQAPAGALEAVTPNGDRVVLAYLTDDGVGAAEDFCTAIRADVSIGMLLAKYIEYRVSDNHEFNE